jgi:pyruvate formate lyase activating enzyme
LRFAGFQKTSLIDYPNRVASVLFTAGCNLRCPYCHNGGLVHDYIAPFIEEEEVVRVLLERKQYVDSIVVTGGEPTMNLELPIFLSKLMEHGFNVKLDTNGLNPDMLRECLPYVDYIAMDVKTSLVMYEFLGAKDVSPILESINLIMVSGIDYEFRCTVVPGFVDEDTIPRMGEMVKGARKFVFQQFRPENTLNPVYYKVKPYADEMIRRLARIIECYVDMVILRI